MCKRSSSSSLNLSALCASNGDESSGSYLFQRRGTKPAAVDGALMLDPREYFLQTLLALMAFHVSPFVIKILDLMRPEVFSSAEVFKAALMDYRDEYVRQQASVMEGMKSAASAGMLSRSSATSTTSSLSDEFMPRAKLIADTQPSDEDFSSAWGHFADFDAVEEQDVMFIGNTSKLTPLEEHQEEDE